MKAKFNLNKEIGIRIKAVRRRTDYTQDDIASMLGMTRSNYVNIERGNQAPPVKHIYTLCRIFNCYPTSLFPPIKEATIVEKIIKLAPKVRTKTTFKLI